MKRRLLQIWGALPIPPRLRWWMVLATVRKFPVGVAAAILDDAGRILLFRHTYRGKYPWGLPTGWLEPREQPDRAVAREVREETGLEVGDIRVLLIHSAPDARRIDMIYRGTITGGQFRPSAEVTEIRWFDPAELPEMMASQYVMISEIYRVLGLNPRTERSIDAKA